MAIDWPGRVAAERAFGAFADALGFKDLRDMQTALEQLAQAQTEEFMANAAYLRVALQAQAEALAQWPAALQTSLGDGPAAATSPIALLRLWMSGLDAAMHRVMLSDAGLDATAAAVRARSQRRLQLQRVVGFGAQALGAPTRQEMDDAHREIQELKRELRRLKAAAAKDGA